jgi:hypothetical protein
VPERSFQHAATTSSPIPLVWSALDEPQTWEAVPGVDRVFDPVLNGSGQLMGFAFETIVGGKTHLGRAVPAGRQEKRLMAWDITTTEIRGRVTVGLSPSGDGTRVYVELRVEGVGVLGNLFFPVIASAIGSGFPGTVEDFAERLGSG